MNDKKPDTSSDPWLLQCLDSADHLELLRLGKRCFIEKNSFAFKAGDSHDSVYLVERGCFKVFQTTTKGKNMWLSCRGAGELLGLRGALWPNGNKVRKYSAKACVDSEILTYSASSFMAFVALHPGLTFNIVMILLQRLNDVNDILTSLAMTNTTSRVARLILHCYRCYGLHVSKSMDMGVPLSQQEIADMAGVARQTVSGILSEFKFQGVVSVTHKHIRIESESKLVKLAYSDCAQES